MKQVFLFTFLMAGFPSIAQEEKTFSKEELLADYDTLHAWITSVHPKLYANADSVATEKKWAEQRRKINRSMTQWEFHKDVAPVVHQYNDAHTYVEINFEEASFKKFRNEGGLLFPIPLKLFGDSLVALSDSINYVEPGSLITKINGKPAGIFLPAVRSLMSGDNAANRNANCSRLFAYLFWLAYKAAAPYEVEYRTPAGAQKRTTLKGLSVENYFKRIFPSPLWTMTIHPDADLAVIECTGYNGNIDRIRQKLDSFFAVIKSQNIRHVALDLRRNGGGNSYIGNVFLSYVTTKPFAAVSSKSYRNSWAVQNFSDGDFRKKDLEAFKATAEQTSGYLTTRYAPETTNANQPAAAFNGKFYLLTSHRTYSSAHMTAMQVKCANLGTIIGQPTGEMVDLTGEIKDFVLPNTKLPVWIPLAMYTSACPMTEKVGVQPDHYVQPSLADVIANRDAEVSYLKQLIRQQR